MKKTILFSLMLVVALTLAATDIDRAMAKKVAVNFFYERINQFKTVEFESIHPGKIHELRLDGKTSLYAVNMAGGGYVLVSASDQLRPVAGYSPEGIYTGLGLPPQLDELIEIYKLQVREAEEMQAPPDLAIQAMWKHLLTDDPGLLKPLSDEKAVEPMLTTQWDQGQYYNEMCPADPAGPGGHCYAGCVATALGQVVNYFRWPETGTGSYSYECPPYGTLTANFGNTTYEWDKMATSLNRSNPAVALLLHHLGIACDMVYGPNGSGMYNHKAAYALRTFFKYSPETIYVYRDSTSMDWDSLLVAHLDRNIPMYYAGWSVPNINGHAFVCDGYQEGNYYHFNWGWSGSYDGYFYTNSLNPGGSNFNLAQEVVINAFPDTNAYSYPYYCQGEKLLDITDGTIDDGSGPLYGYEPDADCSWLIAPDDSVESITLEFLRFSTEAGDVVSIYDGPTTASPLLGSFEGPDVPGDVSSSGDKVLDRPLSEIGGKALWTKELDAALLAGEIDFAVHSAKDVETIRPPEIVIAAMLPRADVRDRLIGAPTFASLPHGARMEMLLADPSGWADAIAASGKGCAFRKLGYQDAFSIVGYPEDLLHLYKLDGDGILEAIGDVLKQDFEQDEDWEDEI